MTQRGAPIPGVRGWGIAVAGVAVWTIADLAWLRVHRRARLWDHEEVSYALKVRSFGALREPSAMWDSLHYAHTGPFQSLLGAPWQWLVAPDDATVLWENVALTACSGLLVFWAARRLAGDAAGILAAGAILLTPGMLENSRGALTMVPATTFGVLALAALLAGRGLGRRRWALVVGLALGCMILSRPMTVAFMPGLAWPAAVWSARADVPRRVVLGNASVALGTAFATSVWWWGVSHRAIADYLRTGSPGVGTAGPGRVFLDRLYEINLYLGPIVSEQTIGGTWIVAGAAFLVLHGRDRRRARGEDPSEDPPPDAGPPAGSGVEGLTLPVWPIWAAAGTGLALSMLSNTLGLLMLPIVPWMVVAAAAGARRRLAPRSWRWWASIVVIPILAAALFTSVVAVTPGNRFTWCLKPLPSAQSTCHIDDRHEAAEWKAGLRAIGRRTLAVHDALRDAGRRRAVAVVARDHVLLPVHVTLQVWVDHGRWFDTAVELPFDQAPAVQLEVLREQADVVVVVPDVEPVGLYTTLVDPDDLAPRLAADFAPCEEVELPDGREVQVMVRAPAPPEACR